MNRESMAFPLIMFFLCAALLYASVRNYQASRSEERVLPTHLYLTVVAPDQPPQVCILPIATETIRGDTLRVVVHKTKCAALSAP